MGAVRPTPIVAVLTLERIQQIFFFRLQIIRWLAVVETVPLQSNGSIWFEFKVNVVKSCSEFAYIVNLAEIIVFFSPNKIHTHCSSFTCGWSAKLLRAMMSMDYGRTSGREMVRVPSTEGIVSISLNDSWTGKKFLESIGQSSFHSARLTPDELSQVRIWTNTNFLNENRKFKMRKKKSYPICRRWKSEIDRFSNRIYRHLIWVGY